MGRAKHSAVGNIIRPSSETPHRLTQYATRHSSRHSGPLWTIQGHRQSLLSHVPASSRSKPRVTLQLLQGSLDSRRFWDKVPRHTGRSRGTRGWIPALPRLHTVQRTPGHLGPKSLRLQGGKHNVPPKHSNLPITQTRHQILRQRGAVQSQLRCHDQKNRQASVGGMLFNI